MKIRIVIISRDGRLSAYADDANTELRIGFDTVENNSNFARKAIDIVKSWPDCMEDNSIIDGIHYEIMYNDDIGSRTLIGNGETPANFSELIDLIQQHDPKNIEYKRVMQKRMDDISRIIDEIDSQK